MNLHSPEQGRLLIVLARNAIAQELGEPATGHASPLICHSGESRNPENSTTWTPAFAGVTGFSGRATDLPHPDWLDQPGAVFVTLTRQGELRGCIGSLEAHRKLIDDLQANARAAAFKDPRFAPLSRDELAATRVEVSILSPAEPMRFTSEADALAQLRPGIDGVILEHGWHRATFLPQVWEQLPEARQFMANLKRKAGLATDFWADDLRLARYQIEKFKESEA